MKKKLHRTLALFLSLTLMLGLLSGCKSDDKKTEEEQPLPSSEEPAEAAEPHQVSTEDINRETKFMSLWVSPKGDYAIYETKSKDEEENRLFFSLWKLDLTKENAQPEPLTDGGEDDYEPAWSPDGSQIAFIRWGDNGPQVYVMPADGGKAKAVTDNESGVDSFMWAPDGKSIAFTAVTEDRNAEVPEGVTIYKYGDDYLDPLTLSQIFIVPVGEEMGEEKCVTEEKTSPSIAFWSADSKSLYYTTDEMAEYYYGGGKSTLRKVDLESGKASKVRNFKVPGTDKDYDSAPTLIASPDGTKAAFNKGNPDDEYGFQQDEIFVMDIASGKVKNISAKLDAEVGYDGLQWLDNDTILSITNDKAAANLVKIDVNTGKVEELWKGNHTISLCGADASGEKILAVRSDFTNLPELYDVSSKDDPKALTSVNKALQEELIVSEPEEFSYKGPGGQTIHGFLVKPADFDESKKYPMIVYAHGGPFGYFPKDYSTTYQAMAARGYLVMLVNPRGSASYGSDFANALAVGYPGPEFDDIMTGVDYICKRGYVDEEKMGISGESAGGILTDYAIGKTNRFKAAVSISDLADFNYYWFVGDQSDMDTKTEPWLNQSDYKRSPIRYVKNAKTPTLFIAGDADTRCPAESGAKMMFRALKYYKVPTAYISFEGADHCIRNNDDASQQGQSVEYLLRWMDKYIKGEEVPEFDVE
ncbi:MAG: prolyl oligopeptidase family serine peptidase [Anaerovoracaceae bacterium]